MASHHITHCIFDMDGLLLDTERFYSIAQQDILAKHGKQFSWDLKAKMMGKKALDAAKILIEDTGLQGQLTPEQFLTDREEILDRLFPTSQLLPGVDALISHLKASGIPIAVATSSHARHFDLKTSQHKPFFQMFDHIVTGDQVKHGKPHPEIFQAAAAKFAVPPASPANCLVFEDAPTGVEAALAAGMPVVMVPDPQLDRALCQQATAVLSSMEEFDPVQWGLPPFPVLLN
jgi:pseudouridine-5'-monophosphatase